MGLVIAPNRETGRAPRDSFCDHTHSSLPGRDPVIAGDLRRPLLTDIAGSSNMFVNMRGKSWSNLTRVRGPQALWDRIALRAGRKMQHV